MRGIINLSKDTIKEFPFLAKSEISFWQKTVVFLTYLKISFKLFTIHKKEPIREESILGFKVVTFDYGALHFLFREIFIKNTYFFKTIKKDPVIFDCGANIGVAMFYFKWLYPYSTINVFEPDPDTFNLLKKNIVENNLKGVNLHNFALSNKKGDVSFYVDKENPGWLTMSMVKDRLPKNRIKIKSDRLSSFIKKEIDFLKMDVEGAEMKIIKDLELSGKIEKIKKMYIEFHNKISEELKLEDFLNILKRNGFNYWVTNFQSLDLSKAQDIEIYAEKK